MKKLFVVLAILFIGILLAGCTSQQAAPVATPTRRQSRPLLFQPQSRPLSRQPQPPLSSPTRPRMQHRHRPRHPSRPYTITFNSDMTITARNNRLHPRGWHRLSGRTTIPTSPMVSRQSISRPGNTLVHGCTVTIPYGQDLCSDLPRGRCIRL